MQKACEKTPSTMAAIIGLNDSIVEEVCASINEVVVPANYNSPGQIVISGTNEGIDKDLAILKEKGAKRALKLAVGGAFHSPLMEPARLEFEQAVNNTTFSKPVCPVYQNIGGHMMGHVYIGPVGLVLTYFYHGLDNAAYLVDNCLNCLAC